MATIIDYLQKGASGFKPVDSYLEGQKNKLALDMGKNDLDTQPKRNQLLDLQLQSTQNQIDAQEMDFINKASEQQRAQIAEQADRAAFIAQQAQTPQELINGLASAGIDPDPNLAGMDINTARNSVLSKSKAYREAALKAREAKPTSLQQNLLAAGLKEGTPEYKNAILQSTTKPLVSIGADKKEREEIAKIQAKRFDMIVDRGEAARDALDNINQLEAIDVKTGALEPAKAAFASIVEGLGFDGSAIANVTNAQAFEGVSNRMVNDVLNRAKGPQTEGDAKRAKSTLASLKNTPLANKFMNASLKALALRQIEQSDFIEARIDQGKTFSEANKEWNDFKRKTPSLSSVVKDENGLPVFFYQFKERAKQIRPNITDDEIINAWREKHGK